MRGHRSLGWDEKAVILVRIHPAPEVRADDVRQIALGVAGREILGCIWSISLQLDNSPHIFRDDEIASETCCPVELVRQALAIMPAIGFSVQNITPDSDERSVLRALCHGPKLIVEMMAATDLSRNKTLDCLRRLEEWECVEKPAEARRQGRQITPRGVSFCDCRDSSRPE